MNERLDLATWSAVRARLADVEPFIPEPPAWRPATDTAGRVGLGSAFPRTDARLRRRSRLVLVLALVGLLAALVAGALLIGGPRPGPDLSETPFGPLGSLRGTNARSNAALLPDGRVLIVSGEWVGPGGEVGPRVAIWDADAGMKFLDPPITNRINPTTTLLLDGRVLTVGGYGGPYQYPSSALATAEVWDPVTEQWTATGPMAHARVGHTATLLLDGRVLIVGGLGPDGPVAAAEVWDPVSGTVHEAGRLTGGRTGHTATLLGSGEVWVMGGGGLGQLWRPGYENFTSSGGWLDRWDSMAAARLPDGRSVFVGGLVDEPNMRLNDVYIEGRPEASQPSTVWGLLRQARFDHAAVALRSGLVLVLGGRTAAGDVLDSVEALDPATGVVEEAMPLARPVAGHAAILLDDGSLLIVPDWSGPDGVIEPFVYDPAGDR